MGKYLIEGNKLKRQGKLEEAIASYKRAIEINPNSAWSYHNLGETLAKINRLDEAIISYRRAIEINPNSAWSYYELGEVLAAKGDFDAALINYRRAWELEPNFEGFTRGLENALEKLSDRRQNQESGPTFFKQAKSHFAKRFWSETVRSCRQAIEAGLEEAECYKMLGWSLKKQRQWDEAIAAYLKVIELNPKDGDAYYWLGDILRMRGRLGEAIALYQKGVATLPENVQLKEGLQQFTAEQKQREINQQANKQLSNYR
ncbi:MAG: tetratricopeptide repeat protein, partial [Okeania sp. SIO2H7]|nr:tetratricopeptide repeat protein [Okeania sp. SIO2H7]